jgi:uncharacterized membrane protein YoaT (DUF817 family)
MRTGVSVLTETIFVILCVFIIAFMWSDNALLSIVSLAGCSIALYIWHRERSELLLFITGAVIGPTVEIICIHYGAWSYSNPSFWGIPLWLPIVWGYVAVYLKRVHESLLKLRR